MAAPGEGRISVHRLEELVGEVLSKEHEKERSVCVVGDEFTSFKKLLGQLFSGWSLLLAYNGVFEVLVNGPGCIHGLSLELTSNSKWSWTVLRDRRKCSSIVGPIVVSLHRSIFMITRVHMWNWDKVDSSCILGNIAEEMLTYYTCRLYVNSYERYNIMLFMNGHN